MPKPPSSGGEEEEKPRGEAAEELCEMALDPELLLLRDDGEEEFGTSWVRAVGPGGSLGLATLASSGDCGARMGPCGPRSTFSSGFL